MIRSTGVPPLLRTVRSGAGARLVQGAPPRTGGDIQRNLCGLSI